MMKRFWVLVVLVLTGCAGRSGHSVFAPQAEAQEIRRATLDSNATVASSVCAGSNTVTSPGSPYTNWYDASGNATSGTMNSTTSAAATTYKAHKVTSWAAASGSYTTLSLVVESASSGGNGTSNIQYSTNAGSTWTTIRSGAIWARVVDTVVLSAGQSLSTLQVRACESLGGGTIDTPVLQSVIIYDIRTEATTSTIIVVNGGTHYVPTTTLSEQKDNNTSGCAATNAPSVTATGTGCVDNFPVAGVTQTHFPISSIARTGGSTVKAIIVDNYNFSTSQPDQVVISGVTDAANFPNGTYTVTAVGACTSSGDPSCYVQYTQTVPGANVSSSGGTATRYAQTAPFVPGPKNVANFSNDGMDVHLMPFLGGTGGTSTTTACVHFMLWFATNGSNGDAIFTPADGTSSSDLDHGMNISNGSHVTVGYASNSTAQVAAQINAMKRLNLDCLLADSYGLPISGMSTQRTNETGALSKIAANLAGQSAFQFAALIDDAGFKTSYWCGSSSQTPSCVEKYLECSWDYYHYNTNQNFVCPFNGITYAGCGFFNNTAYLTIGGKPITGTFMAEGGYFTGCGAGCAVYNNGTGSVTCTSSSDCWTKVYAGVALHQASWTTKPIYYWRNSFSAHAVGATTDQGSYRWINPTGDRSNTDFPGYDSNVTTSLSSSRHFMATAYAHNDHAQSSFQNDNLGMEGYCGKTWLQSWARPNLGGAYSTSHDVELYQILTWNDLEQGTMIENGIDSCYTIGASMGGDGHTLSWTISTSDATQAPLVPLNSTLHHISLYVSLDGVNAMQLGPNISPTATGTVDLAGFNLDAGSFNVYVKLVPWTNMQTSITAAIPFTALGVPAGSVSGPMNTHRTAATAQ